MSWLSAWKDPKPDDKKIALEDDMIYPNLHTSED